MYYKGKYFIKVSWNYFH